MLWLLMWTLYGLVVGFIAKLIYPGPEPNGFLATAGIGIVGSYLGGFINFLIGRGDPFQPSGIFMGIVGGIVFCFIYNKFKLNQYLTIQALKDEANSSSQKDEE